MTAERQESAPGRALWGLQLIGGAALASMVASLSMSLVSLPAVLAEDRFSAWEPLQPIFELSPYLYLFIALVSATGWWLAGAMPRHGLAFRCVGVLVATQSLTSFLKKMAVRRQWIEDVGSFFDWFQWVALPLWILVLIGIAGVLGAAARRSRGRVLLMGLALALAIGRSVVYTFWKSASQFFVEHPIYETSVSVADTVLWGAAVVLLAAAVRRRYHAGGLGSYRVAAEGLGRYRSAITMRIVLAVSVVVLSFMAVAARSMVLVQLVLSASVVVGVAVAVHAARGLIGFARQPIEAGGGIPATAAALIGVFTLLYTGVGLLELPDVFDKGGSFRDAAEGLQAVGNFANILGFAGVICILVAIARLARHLGDSQLVSRAQGLMALIAIAAGAVIFLQQFGAAGMIRSSGGLIATGIVVLVAAIVGLVRYLSLLSDVETKLMVDHGIEPPKATATVRED